MEASNPVRFHRKSPQELGFDSRRLERISVVIDRALEAGQTTGVLTAVLRDGSLAWFDTRGCRDLASGKPIEADTLFRIYSMTKPVTTAAVMMLVEETAIRLGDPVSRFFPEYREMEVYVGGDEPPFLSEPAAREITVRDLLTHTAGLAYGIGEEHPVEKLLESDVWGPVARDGELSLRELAKLVGACPLVHQPGTHFRYSIAIDLLGALVEEVSGIPFGRFLEERLFDPLGMRNTWFTVPEPDRHRLAGVYTPGETGFEPSPDPPILSFAQTDAHPNGGGGLVSTADDYLAFAQMLLDGGRATRPDGRPGDYVLAPRTVSMMMSDHLPPGVAGWSTAGVGFGYGGAVLTDARYFVGYGSPGRYGWGGAASTGFWVDPAERIAGLVLQQVVPYTPELPDDVLTSVYQAVVA